MFITNPGNCCTRAPVTTRPLYDLQDLLYFEKFTKRRRISSNRISVCGQPSCTRRHRYLPRSSAERTGSGVTGSYGSSSRETDWSSRRSCLTRVMWVTCEVRSFCLKYRLSTPVKLRLVSSNLFIY